MVTLTNFTARTNDAGEEFFTLTLQGDLEMVKSNSTGKFYATAMTTSVTSTFNEATCKALVGKQMPGRIIKVECEEYDYTIESTGEVIKISHTYEYVPEEVTQPEREIAEAVIH